LPSTPSSAPPDERPDAPADAPPPSGSRIRRLVAAGAILLVGAVVTITWVAVSGNDGGPDPRLAQVSAHGVATVGEPAPDFSLTAFDGTTVRLAAYRGTPVVVNFWQSYCIPCRQEFPMFRRQLAAHRGKFALIGVDVKDITSDGRAFAKQKHATWPLVEDASSAVAHAYGVRALPQTFFIRADGYFARELALITK
jgi:cytochrome c biogenesis protein CcmG/thiol:disulfide interchange protein DsbE